MGRASELLSRLPGGRRWFLAPEVIQSSAVDCGPAALKCMLEGFGIAASYGRLREACQTEVDGTSIDAIEEVCRELGLEAVQCMLPLDHLLLPEAQALPAILVVRNPLGLTHFVVVWRNTAGLLQVMDPASGRRWRGSERFLAEVYLHSQEAPAALWREWAGSEPFRAATEARLRRIGLAPGRIRRLFERARSDPGWWSLAALDAAVRLVTSLVESRGVARGERAEVLLVSLLEQAREDPERATEIIPSAQWMVRPAAEPGGAEPSLLVRGAVLIRVSGRRAGRSEPAYRPQSSELRKVVEEPRSRPFREILAALREDGLLAPSVLISTALVASGVVVFEALLLRGLLDLGARLGLELQRAGAMALLISIVLVLLLVEGPLMGGLARSGRHLEASFRLRFLSKLPRLGDRYFRSRLASDMAERCHSLNALRELPMITGQLARAGFELVLTTAGILWLDPGLARLAVPMAVAIVALPFVLQPLLTERELKLRSHNGALSRFHLDVLLGAMPIRSHGAEAAVKREHDDLLAEWTDAGLSLQRTVVATESVLLVTGFGLTVWLLFDHIGRHGESATNLLLLYWLLRLPILSQGISGLLRRYPRYRNIVHRLLETMTAPEEGAPLLEATPPPADAAARRSRTPAGVSVVMEDVTVRAGGHTILDGVNLRVEPGERVAIVGRSGAGKSTLVGLLLGWHGATSGRLLVDGEELGPERYWAMRRQIAWIDPSVQLWNRSLLSNLLYGSDPGGPPMSRVLEEADLRQVVGGLPEGLHSPLGEGGAQVSGGQGQRVRVGRGLRRPGVRLAILDEAFRGLDHGHRRTLFDRLPTWWPGATLLCVTHEIDETLAFERVVVVEGGRIVETGVPSELAGRAGSAYARLLDAQAGRPLDSGWSRVYLAAGTVTTGGRDR